MIMRKEDSEARQAMISLWKRSIIDEHETVEAWADAVRKRLHTVYGWGYDPGLTVEETYHLIVISRLLENEREKDDS